MVNVIKVYIVVVLSLFYYMLSTFLLFCFVIMFVKNVYIILIRKKKIKLKKKGIFLEEFPPYTV